MRTCVFDLETSSLYANTGIVLCCVIKEFSENGKGKKTVLRADDYPSWDKCRTHNKAMISDVVRELDKYDIFVAHNGQYFDKTWLTSACLKYGLRPSLRFEKFIDPVLLARRHMRLARNSLATLIEYFDIEGEKTPIRWIHWMKASMEGNRQSMGYIVHHCEVDVDKLEEVYMRVKKLVKGVDEQGSSR
jgi:hypothetical protein